MNVYYLDLQESIGVDPISKQSQFYDMVVEATQEIDVDEDLLREEFRKKLIV